MKSILGSKGNGAVWRTLINQIPPHDEFIEPFLGLGTLMRKKRPAARNVGCDLDGETLAAFQSVHGRDGVELYQVDGLEWIRHRFGLYTIRGATVLQPSDVLDALYGGRRSTIPFVYFDPPYPEATRTSDKRYRFELDDAGHVALIRVARSIPALVMVSSYPSPLYEREFKGSGWRTFKFKGHSRGGVRTEQVWMNYPEPQLLHDWRFAGRNKRERERIMRRVRNFQRMVADMLPVERQAVLDAIIEDGPRVGRSTRPTQLVCVRCQTFRPSDVPKCPVCRGPVESRIVFSGVF